MPDQQTPEELQATADAANQTTDALNKQAVAADKAGVSLNNLDEFALGAKNAFSAFSNTLTSYGLNIRNISSFTEQQTNLLGLLTTAALGTKTAFDNLGNIDTSKLSTFSDQLDYLRSTFTDAQSGIGQLVNFAQKAFNTMVPTTVIAQGIGAVNAFVNNLAKSADNALRVQNAYIQLSARTGNLSEVYAAAGPNLENINALIEKQTALVNNAVQTTGLLPKTVQEYYSQLGTVPKALEATVKTGQGSSDTMSMLTASIKAAVGTGRSFSDVVDDMKIAFKDYNLTGEDALKFTTRISEISNKFGVNLEEVRRSLRGTADTFKMFGNEAEGAVRILNNYVGALKTTGLSGDVAVDVVTNMTGAINNLGIAQKAFLSAQTGGPGGLMGAFQVEKMLREGKIDQVFEKVRQTMQKQFGQIINLEEAAKSPAAAAQLTKQIQILRQGPLGQFARTDQEAIRVLEGFRAKQEGRAPTTDLSNKVVQNSIDKGTDIQGKSYTELSRIRGLLEGFRGTADLANLANVQRAATVGTGTPFVETSAQRASKAGLRSSISAAEVAGGVIGQDYGSDIKNKAPINQTAKRALDSIMGFQKMFADIPASMQAPLDALKQSIGSGKMYNTQAELKALKDEIDQEKAKVAKLPKQERDKALAIIRGQENVYRNASAYFSAAGGVGAAANRATGLRNRPGVGPIRSGIPGEEAHAGHAAALGKLGEIMVNITGYCLRCKQEIEGGQQSAAVNPVGAR